jgi:hypothetical protein
MTAYFRQFTNCNHFYVENLRGLYTILLSSGTDEKFNWIKVLILGETQAPIRHTGKKMLILGALPTFILGR